MLNLQPLSFIFQCRKTAIRAATYWDWIGMEYLTGVEGLTSDSRKSIAHHASDICDLPPISITQKTPCGVTDDKRDYVSFAPYWWPEEGSKEDAQMKSRNGGHRRDGFANPRLREASDKPRFAQVCARIHCLACAYLVDNDEKYLAYIDKQLSYFFICPITGMKPHLKFGQIQPWTGAHKGSGIIDTRWLILALDGLAMVRAAGGQLEIEEKVKVWVRSYLRWLLTSRAGRKEFLRDNNRGSWYDVQVAFLAEYLGYASLVRTVCELSMKRRFAKQFASSGQMPLEFVRYSRQRYSVYNIYPLRLMLEMCRFHDVETTVSRKKLDAAVDFLESAPVEDEAYDVKERADDLDFIAFDTNYDLNLFYPYDLPRLKAVPVVWPA